MPALTPPTEPAPSLPVPDDVPSGGPVGGLRRVSSDPLLHDTGVTNSHGSDENPSPVSEDTPLTSTLTTSDGSDGLFEDCLTALSVLLDRGDTTLGGMMGDMTLDEMMGNPLTMPEPPLAPKARDTLRETRVWQSHRFTNLLHGLLRHIRVEFMNCFTCHGISINHSITRDICLLPIQEKF